MSKGPRNKPRKTSNFLQLAKTYIGKWKASLMNDVCKTGSPHIENSNHIYTSHPVKNQFKIDQ
jgi:hypothetical protein